MRRVADDAASVSDAAPATMRVAMPDREESDNYLLGAAALAVAAAVGIALQRRAQQEIGNFRINFRPTVRGETV